MSQASVSSPLFVLLAGTTVPSVALTVCPQNRHTCATSQLPLLPVIPPSVCFRQISSSDAFCRTLEKSWGGRHHSEPMFEGLRDKTAEQVSRPPRGSSSWVPSVIMDQSEHTLDLHNPHRRSSSFYSAPNLKSSHVLPCGELTDSFLGLLSSRKS